jgi:hypothetical protein
MSHFFKADDWMDLASGVPSPVVPLQVKLRDGSVLSILANRYDTVLHLKESLAVCTGIYASQQRLVYAGYVLADEMSLDYYRIRSGSQLFFVAADSSLQVGQRPYQMLSDLLHLLDELPSAESRRFSEIINDIRYIISNSTVRASARIDPEVKQLLEEAEETINNAKRPISRRMHDFLARLQDCNVDPCDLSGDDLDTVVNDELDKEDDDAPPTNIRYRKHVSNQPLPLTWTGQQRTGKSVFHRSAMRLSFAAVAPAPGDSITSRKATFDSGGCTSARSRFSRQLAVLRNMGFHDERVMLDALSQTNGNVQLAARLIQNKEHCKEMADHGI